jgi:hypothetical protein
MQRPADRLMPTLLMSLWHQVYMCYPLQRGPNRGHAALSD